MRSLAVFSLFFFALLSCSGCGSINKGHFFWWGCTDPVRLANAELIRAEASVRSAEADRYQMLAQRQDNILSELERDRRGLPQADQEGSTVQPTNPPKEYKRENAHVDCAVIESSLGNITRLATGTIINETKETFRAEIRSPGAETRYYSIPGYSVVPAYIPYGQTARVIVTHQPSGATREVIKQGEAGFTTTLRAAQ